MTQHDPPEFDDPALKAALRHAYQGERAPAQLRQRIVAQMVEGEAEPASGGKRISRWRIGAGAKPLRLLAAACIALVAVGVAAYQIKVNLFPERYEYMGPSSYTAKEIPESFAMEMVKTHEACAKLPDHHLVAGDDSIKLTEALTTQSKVPVVVVNLSGWQFKGAGMCQVGEVTGAHLVYAKANGQTVSIFELPADAVYHAPQGATYSQTVDGHAISGFRHGTGLYCVVGSAGKSAPTMPEVEQMRGVLRAALPAVECDMGGGGAVARL